MSVMIFIVRTSHLVRSLNLASHTIPAILTCLQSWSQLKILWVPLASNRPYASKMITCRIRNTVRRNKHQIKHIFIIIIIIFLFAFYFIVILFLSHSSIFNLTNPTIFHAPLLMWQCYLTETMLHDNYPLRSTLVFFFFVLRTGVRAWVMAIVKMYLKHWTLPKPAGKQSMLIHSTDGAPSSGTDDTARCQPRSKLPTMEIRVLKLELCHSNNCNFNNCKFRFFAERQFTLFSKRQSSVG